MSPQNFIEKIVPPVNWRFPVLILIGILTGLLLFVLHIGRATSYLSDDPDACTNCHVMAPQYATWEKGSHGRVATCNDCHSAGGTSHRILSPGHPESTINHFNIPKHISRMSAFVY